MENNDVIASLQKQIESTKEEVERRTKESLDRILAEEKLKKEEDENRKREDKALYEAKVKAHEELMRKQREALEIERKKAQDAAYALEMEKLKAQKVREEQSALIENLKRQITEAEFCEDQNRKLIENAKTVAENSTEESIAEETNDGNAVKGTSGETPRSPLMSDHLKNILRQAERKY